jgi:hypothetical protein
VSGLFGAYMGADSRGSYRGEIRERATQKVVGYLVRFHTFEPFHAVDLNGRPIGSINYGPWARANPGMIVEALEREGVTFPERVCTHPVEAQHKDGCGECGAWVARSCA